MTNLRKALLGGAALAVMATGAQADELTALKAQLEALQSRVDSMESAPAATVPAGYNLIMGRRGAADYNFAASSHELQETWAGGENSGYTIAITPTADMPAPVAEITVSGYVSSWVYYGIDGNNTSGAEAGGFNPWYWADGDDAHLNINARGALRVRSKVDTAIGQIRTDLELRADVGGNGQSESTDATFRYAWGEWDMTPNWTLGAGNYWQTNSLIGLPTTVNSSTALGVANTTRRDQVRLTYTDGPLSWAVAMEEPTFESTTAMPDITTSIVYDVAGGHQFQIVAGVSDWGDAVGATSEGDCYYEGINDFIKKGQTEDWCDGAGGTWKPWYDVKAKDDLAWMIGGSTIFNLADVANFSFAAVYGEGMAGRNNAYIGGKNANTSHSSAALAWDGTPRELWGMTAGLGFAINDTTSFNVFGGYEQDLETLGKGAAPGDAKSAWNVGANIFWQPVKQMRMGWEVNYGEAKYYGWNDDTLSECEGSKQASRGQVVCGEDTDKSEALQIMWHTRFFF